MTGFTHKRKIENMERAQLTAELASANYTMTHDPDAEIRFNATRRATAIKCELIKRGPEKPLEIECN